METKSLLYGITGFILGGLLVSIAATTFDKPTPKTESNTMSMTMDDMTNNLKNKTGDNFDKAFISEMIEHHEGAVAMAKLASSNARHNEIKQLSNDIIAAQEKEINAMKQWQTDWGYTSSNGMQNMQNSMH